METSSFHVENTTSVIGGQGRGVTWEVKGKLWCILSLFLLCFANSGKLSRTIPPGDLSAGLPNLAKFPFGSNLHSMDGYSFNRPKRL